jgi:hypothetical protein
MSNLWIPDPDVFLKDREQTLEWFLVLLDCDPELAETVVPVGRGSDLRHVMVALRSDPVRFVADGLSESTGAINLVVPGTEKIEVLPIPVGMVVAEDDYADFPTVGHLAEVEMPDVFSDFDGMLADKVDTIYNEFQCAELLDACVQFIHPQLPVGTFVEIVHQVGMFHQYRLSDVYCP